MKSGLVCKTGKVLVCISSVIYENTCTFFLGHLGTTFMFSAVLTNGNNFNDFLIDSLNNKVSKIGDLSSLEQILSFESRSLF